jgi:hypothetical protein
MAIQVNRGWHTLPGAGVAMQGTFSLGANAKISRFVLWERMNSPFGYQNIKRMTLWGSDKGRPTRFATTKNSSAGTISGDWVTWAILCSLSPHQAAGKPRQMPPIFNLLQMA